MRWLSRSATWLWWSSAGDDVQQAHCSGGKLVESVLWLLLSGGSSSGNLVADGDESELGCHEFCSGYASSSGFRNWAAVGLCEPKGLVDYFLGVGYGGKWVADLGVVFDCEDAGREHLVGILGFLWVGYGYLDGDLAAVAGGE